MEEENYLHHTYLHRTSATIPLNCFLKSFISIICMEHRSEKNVVTYSEWIPKAITLTAIVILRVLC